MLSREMSLNQVVDSVHQIMKRARSLKSSAVLRNLTGLSPTAPSDMRWSGKHQMLLRFLGIKGDFVQATENSYANFDFDGSHAFSLKIQKSSEFLAEIDTFTKSLQGYGRTLGNFADDIDVLMETNRQAKITQSLQCTRVSSNTIKFANIAHLGLS